MTRRALFICVLLASVIPTAAANAAEPEPAPDQGSQANPPAEEGEEGPAERARDHANQGFVSVLFGTGWYMVAPYDKDDPEKMCAAKEGEGDEEGEALCTGRSGVHLDFLAGYAVRPGFELFGIFRLGLERPDGPNAPLTRQLGAGLRVYSPSDGLFKMSIGVAPLFDFSDRKSDAIGKDLVFHVPIGAQFDFIPWLGAYAQVAPNVSFFSEFRIDITAGVGVQGRFP